MSVSFVSKQCGPADLFGVALTIMRTPEQQSRAGLNARSVSYNHPQGCSLNEASR